MNLYRVLGATENRGNVGVRYTLGNPKQHFGLARRDAQGLTKAGLTARRLHTGESLPTAGWLVRGMFTDVNQGNQLCRAVIGFGVGKTDLQVLVDIKDLAHGAPRPFYELNTTADSGKAPGAGPMIVLNPAAGAARFVMAGKDLNRNVKQTASKIAVEVGQRTQLTISRS